MSGTSVVLLGPQFHHPSVGATLHQLGVDGPVATITAGWQEREGEDQALMRELGGRGLPLRLHERAEAVWQADPELRDAHKRMQLDLRALRGLYNRQLAPAAAAWFDLLALERPARLIEPERAAALDAIRRLDDHLIERVREIRADFEKRMQPLERPSVRHQRERLAEALAPASAVVIEGGHVAVLLNRILLFGVEQLLHGKVLIGCSAGAMALCERVLLYNDEPATGKGHSEVALPGLGLAPGIVALPDATARLRTGDPERMRRLAVRVEPAVCALLDPGARLYWDGSGWTGLHVHRIQPDGALMAWERAA